MASEVRTPFADLNNWAGNEFPKRTDFVEDNIKIDTALQSLNTAIATKADMEDVNTALGSIDLSAYVLKEPGKGLSDRNYTQPEKDKVANLPANITTEIDTLKTSVVDGKGTIATAINDLAGSAVANSSMTHADLSVRIRQFLGIATGGICFFSYNPDILIASFPIAEICAQYKQIIFVSNSDDTSKSYIPYRLTNNSGGIQGADSYIYDFTRLFFGCFIINTNVLRPLEKPEMPRILLKTPGSTGPSTRYWVIGV